MGKRGIRLAAAIGVGLLWPAGAATADSAAELARACTWNLGPQALTVHTTPGDTVAYSTEYSDHSNELTNPSYRTGSGAGTADATGTFHAVWLVPATAPLGIATVHLIYGGALQPSLEFEIAAPLGC